MEISYDKFADTLSIRVSREKCKESDEIKPGVILDYGKNGNLIGIEILSFSQRKINLNNIIKLDPDELVPNIIECT